MVLPGRRVDSFRRNRSGPRPFFASSSVRSPLRTECLTQIMCKRTAFPETIHNPSTSASGLIPCVDTVITNRSELQCNYSRQFRFLFPVAAIPGASYSWQAFKRCFAIASFAFYRKFDLEQDAVASMCACDRTSSRPAATRCISSATCRHTTPRARWQPCGCDCGLLFRHSCQGRRQRRRE